MRTMVVVVTLALASGLVLGSYTNFESSQVHPITLTPSGSRLLVLNTPDALLEVFTVDGGGVLTHEKSIPVGLEPVSVVARNDDEAWVANLLSDTVSIVDIGAGVVSETLPIGDEPTDIAFANGKAFVTSAQENAIKVFNLSDLSLAPATVPVFGRKPRALAVSGDGSKVYATVLFSGNQTTVVNPNVIFGNDANLDDLRLFNLGLNAIECDGAPPAYPALPAGVVRNPALIDPPSGIPQVGLILAWDAIDGRWEDETGVDWGHCVPFTMPDHDLFVIDTTSLAVSEVDHLGTSLFDVSVHPGSGKIYVPNTDARNFVRFEHPLGVQGHIVENLLSIVDPSDGFSVTQVDLNTHINRASDPATNLAERQASISQPGMLVWNDTGSVGYLTGIGSRKLFKVDGSCTTGSCIFGPTRAAPQAVEVGEGPTGVALLESASRLYVLNRFTNSLAIVDSVSLTKLDELSLHDPSSGTIKVGRRLMYDSILGSGHGDAACSSCHISGDRDDLGWDLGDPTGDFTPYTTVNDNVRFIVPLGGVPFECPDISLCSSHDGFDPQKGPMTTQTLRGMLEPLHWRGDRATMNDFNMAFVGLMGTADIGPINGKPAGLSAVDMERFRQFALDIDFPPNPLREVDDTLPDAPVPVPGSPFSGNPTTGEAHFNFGTTDGGQPCVACHAHPFGAAGGKRRGVPPSEPTSSDAAALFNGDADQSPHSDLKIAHMRNMYEKLGPRFGDHVGADPEAISGFGFAHDGTVPDLGTFFSVRVFTLTPQAVRDVSAFTMHFPTGTRPGVGQNLTVPAGSPPTGSSAEESLLSTLIALGDSTDVARHCELVATAKVAGRVRSFHLASGSWVTDVATEPALSTLQLRESAAGPLTFLCATLGAGPRLGGDRDQDTVLNGDDCDPADPTSWGEPSSVVDVQVSPDVGGTRLTWDDQAVAAGPSLRYEVAGALLSELRSLGLAATSCLEGGLDEPEYVDSRPDPPAADGHYYLVQSSSPCGIGGFGAGREVLDALICP